MSPTSIGSNLRVTGHSSQGGRKYMEDFFSVAYQQSEDEKDLEYAFFGIYDGHGGSEAATFAKEHLMNAIVNQKLFWSDCDQDVLRAIREGYIATHYAMWREQEKWPKTATGLPSTAGTTASVAFIRRGKIFIGHVGDSGIVLGYQEEGEKCWRAKPLTHDHKPECNVEKARIINSGGKVVTKSGVPRVVWNRPRIGHKGPVRRSTPIDEIPFLAVARSLGDLWSYNSALNEFVVSPDPDVKVVKIDPKSYRCLIFGTDGLWNVLSPSDAIDVARDAEIVNERLAYIGGTGEWTNPSKCLVDKALDRWNTRKMRADNTSVVTIMLDPPGPPKREAIMRNCPSSSYGLEYIQMDGVNGQFSNDYGNYPHNDISTATPMHDDSGITLYDHMRDQQVREKSTHEILDKYVMPDSGYAVMTSYENESGDSSNNDNSHNEVSEVDARIEYHSYHSLDETGLAGHDHVHHHHPNSYNQQQQDLYQQQCMSAEEGYSLTKLETRGEQQFNSIQSYRQQNVSFQEFGEESSYNQYDSISSSYQQPIIVSPIRGPNPDLFDDDTMMGSEKANSVHLLQPQSVMSKYFEDGSYYEPNLVLSQDSEKKSLVGDVHEPSENRLSLDESIQINEISSSVVEPTTRSIPEQEGGGDEPLDIVMTSENINDHDQKQDRTSSMNLSLPAKSTSNKYKTNQKSFPSEQNENRSISERRQLRSSVDYNKRTLRSRNSLSKDMKAKITAQSHHLRRTTIANHLSAPCTKLRSRQLHQQQQVTIWQPKQNRKSTKIQSSAMQCDSISSKSDLKLKQPLVCSKPKTSVSISSNKLQSKTLSSSSSYIATSSVSSTTMSKRSTSSRNSAWCPGKNAVQTRNRVQKRLSH